MGFGSTAISVIIKIRTKETWIHTNGYMLLGMKNTVAILAKKDSDSALKD